MCKYVTLSAILSLSGCLLPVENEDQMPAKQGISNEERAVDPRVNGPLNFSNRTSIGFNDVIAPGAINPLAEINSWDTPEITVSGKNEATEILTVTAEAVRVSHIDPRGAAGQVLLYGVLTFRNGNSRYGTVYDPPAPPIILGANTPELPLTEEVIFDINAGTMFSVPADGATLKVRYTAVLRGTPLPGWGAVAGPNYRVNGSLAYGVSRSVATATKTDAYHFLAPSGSFGVYKPNFAKSLYVRYWVAGKADAQPADLTIIFFDGIGNTIYKVTGYEPTPYVEQIIDWPVDAETVVIINNTQDQSMTVAVVHQLAF